MGVEWLSQELCLEKDRTVPEATPTFKEHPGKPWKNTGGTVLKVAMKWSNGNFHQPDSLLRLLRFSNILKVSSWCFFHTERCQWSPDVLSIRTVSSLGAERLHRHTRNLGFSILFFKVWVVFSPTSTQLHSLVNYFSWFVSQRYPSFMEILPDILMSFSGVLLCALVTLLGRDMLGWLGGS